MDSFVFFCPPPGRIDAKHADDETEHGRPDSLCMSSLVPVCKRDVAQLTTLSGIPAMSLNNYCIRLLTLCDGEITAISSSTPVLSEYNSTPSAEQVLQISN